MIPAELSGALGAVSRAFAPPPGGTPPTRPARQQTSEDLLDGEEVVDIEDAIVVEEPTEPGAPA